MYKVKQMGISLNKIEDWFLSWNSTEEFVKCALWMSFYKQLNFYRCLPWLSIDLKAPGRFYMKVSIFCSCNVHDVKSSILNEGRYCDDNIVQQT